MRTRVKPSVETIDQKIERLARKIRPVLRRYDVVKASLFGSFARGEEGKKSDIDILVKFKGQKSLIDLVELEMELKGLLRKKVDLLTYNSLHPLLRTRILDEQKSILDIKEELS